MDRDNGSLGSFRKAGEKPPFSPSDLIQDFLLLVLIELVVQFRREENPILYALLHFVILFPGQLQYLGFNLEFQPR
jgi:hypothetical protein